jgi:hypothetical protein
MCVREHCHLAVAVLGRATERFFFELFAVERLR